MPQCMICGKRFKAVTNSHVRTHGMSMDEYRKQFPTAKLTDESIIEKVSWAGRGRKHTRKTRYKISRALRGRKRGPLSKGHKQAISIALKGREHTEEHRRHISESHNKIDHPWLKGPRKERIIKKCPFCGTANEYLPHEAKVYKGFCSQKCWRDYIREDPSRHHNWKGGLSQSPYSLEFSGHLKQEIRKRDGFICQLCGKSEGENASDGRVLAIHHVDYDKANCSPENLVTLCVACNAKVNYNREYWESYFREQVGRR